MKLFTKAIDEMLFKQYPLGSDLSSQMVVAKIFNPYGRGTWYLLNSDPQDPDYIWAIVDLFDVEMGSISRSELEGLKVPPFRLGLERDTFFTPINALTLYQGLMEGKMYANGGSLEDMRKQMEKRNIDVRTKIVQLIGIDETLESLQKDYVISPFRLLDNAIARGFITTDDITSDLWFSALEKAEEIDERYRDSGEGIGSSDMGYFVRSMLNNGGIEVKMADGGVIKWQDVYEGDSANVKAENKTGVIVKTYGRKFHLKFVDGSEKTYDASELEFFKSEDEFADGGGIGFIPMDLEEKLAITARWGGTNIKGVIGFLNAMIDSDLTDEDLKPNPTKNTRFQIERAEEKKIQEIWKKIKPKYTGGLEGNWYYSTIKRLVERSRTDDNILKQFKPFRKYQKFADGGEIKFDKEFTNQQLWDFTEKYGNSVYLINGKIVSDKNKGWSDTDYSPRDFFDLLKNSGVLVNFVDKKPIKFYKVGMPSNSNISFTIADFSNFTKSDFLKSIKNAYDKKAIDYSDYISFESLIKNNDFKFLPIADFIDNKMADGGEIMKHKHNEHITIQLIEPTNKGWKVKQIETHSISGKKLSTPKEKVAYFSKDEIKELFQPMMAMGGETNNFIEKTYGNLTEKKGIITTKSDWFNKDGIKVLKYGYDYYLNEDPNTLFYYSWDWEESGMEYASFIEKLKEYFVKKYNKDVNSVKGLYVGWERKEKGTYAMGGETTFKEKVKAVKSSLLKRKKVSPKVQKDYGKTFSPKEAEESAKRIVGSRVAKWNEKMVKK